MEQSNARFIGRVMLCILNNLFWHVNAGNFMYATLMDCLLNFFTGGSLAGGVKWIIYTP